LRRDARTGLVGSRN